MTIKRAELIDDIVSTEWDFFQQVNNTGGRACCQDRPAIFNVMRSSQFAVWTDEMIESYMEDLRVAQNTGRNPLTEKYAHMMQSTYPDEYLEIADAIPPVSEEKDHCAPDALGRGDGSKIPTLHEARKTPAH